MRPGNHENRVTHLRISVFGESKRIGAKTVNINDYVKRVVARSRREWPAILGLVLAGMALVSIPVGVQAQVQQVTDKSRKLKSGNPPEYSGLAKELNLKGVARVMVTVAPDGRVKDVQELGGHPLLLSALVKAVRQWRYQPAAKESSIEVRAEFGPQTNSQ